MSTVVGKSNCFLLRFDIKSRNELSMTLLRGAHISRVDSINVRTFFPLLYGGGN